MSTKPDIPDERRRAILAGAAAAGVSLGLPTGPAFAVDGFDRFMARSEALTGVKPLDRTIGRSLYKLLNANGQVDYLTGYRPAGRSPAGRNEQVEISIISAWYSGVVSTAGDHRLATYQDALMWQQLDFTTPSGLCGGDLGFWSNPPKA